jgi:hypothetical protein
MKKAFVIVISLLCVWYLPLPGLMSVKMLFVAIVFFLELFLNKKNDNSDTVETSDLKL